MLVTKHIIDFHCVKKTPQNIFFNFPQFFFMTFPQLFQSFVKTRLGLLIRIDLLMNHQNQNQNELLLPDMFTHTVQGICFHDTSFHSATEWQWQNKKHR